MKTVTPITPSVTYLNLCIETLPAPDQSEVITTEILKTDSNVNGATPRLYLLISARKVVKARA